MIHYANNSIPAYLAKEYLRLTGTRRVVTDDNKISVGIWNAEPEKAAKFWTDNVDSLDREKREEVETLMPSI